MFNFKKIKNDIYDWANDISANNDRMIEVLSKILPLLSGITKYWKEDHTYIESNKKVVTLIRDLYLYGNIATFLEYYKSEEFQKMVEEYCRLRFTENQSTIKAIYYYAKISNLTINNTQGFVEFLKKLIDLNNAQDLSNKIKKAIIINNYFTIFSNCKMMNLIRRQNGVYATLIGEYEPIEIILGEKGIKIKNGEEEAINYINNLEQLEEYLEEKKIILELDQQTRRK